MVAMIWIELYVLAAVEAARIKISENSFEVRFDS